MYVTQNAYFFEWVSEQLRQKECKGNKGGDKSKWEQQRRGVFFHTWQTSSRCSSVLEGGWLYQEMHLLNQSAVKVHFRLEESRLKHTLSSILKQWAFFISFFANMNICIHLAYPQHHLQTFWILFHIFREYNGPLDHSLVIKGSSDTEETVLLLQLQVQLLQHFAALYCQ